MYIITVLVILILTENSFINCLTFTVKNDTRANHLKSPCDLHMTLYLSSIFKEEWALKMFDATSKLPSGLTNGNSGDFGDFDTCLSIAYNSLGQNVTGKYCLTQMSLSIGGVPETQEKTSKIQARVREIFRVGMHQGRDLQIASFVWAMCVPDICKGDEAAEFLNQVLPIVLSLPVRITADENICQTRASVGKTLSGGAIAIVCVFSIILGTMVVQSAYDTYLHYTGKDSKHSALLAFSVITNGKKLLRVNKNVNQLSCLDGVRFISMLWVVIGHRFTVLTSSNSVVNFMDVIKWTDSGYSMYIVGGVLSVDSFFFVGGVLVSYNFLKAMSKGDKFNIPLYYIHRYIRLTPAYLAMLLVYLTLLPYLGSGPQYGYLARDLQEMCEKYWWGNLLYVQNYVDPQGTCVGQAWYLFVDMQLFIISPLLLIPLNRWPKQTIAGICGIISIIMGYTIYASLHYELGAIPTNIQLPGNVHFVDKYYQVTHTRASPWLIGIILGYVAFQIKTNKLKMKINTFLALALWGVALALMAICIFAGHSTLRGPEYNSIGNALHLAFVKPVWAIALSWLLIACISGYGGPINSFLSWNVFTVLVRFTYCMYLTHALIQLLGTYTSRVSGRFSDFQGIYMFFADVILSIALGTVWTLAFESPIIVLERLLFGNIGRKKVTKENNV